MHKTAQGRGLSVLKDWTNVSGRVAEKYFQPELLRIMNSLRKADNDARSIALGKVYENGDPGSDPISLKALLKSAKTNLNRREYIAAVTELGRFHKKMSDINNILTKFSKVDVNKIHHQFLFQDLDKNQQRKDHLRDLHNRWAAHIQENMVKEAGILDFFVNIGTKRGRALAAWEKRYPEKVRKIKEQSLSILNSSQNLFDNFLQLLSVMATARAERDVDGFVKAIDGLSKIYNKYDNEFKVYYNDTVKPLVTEAEVFVDKTPVPDAKELGKQDVGATSPQPPSGPAPVNVPVPDLNLPAQPPPQPQPVGQTFPAAKPVELPDDSNPNLPHDTEPRIRVEEFPSQKVRVAAHAKFMSSLNALANESPIILAAFIKKYARSIEESDPETSIKLFGIAKSIRG